MQLHKAIQKVSKFVAKGKDAAEILRHVRFFAPTENSPSHVYVTSGDTGSIIPVDLPCPDMALSAKSLAGVSKDPIAQVYLDDGGANTAIFSGAKGSYAIGHYSSTGHPMFPTYPERMAVIPRFGDVLKAAHATLPVGQTLEGELRPDLNCLHFLPDRVEASDLYRMALIDISTGLTGKVPGEVFRFWPAGEVQVAFTEDYAWFRIGEELRFQKLQQGTYARNVDLRQKHVPQYHDGGWMTLPTKELRGIAKKAAQVSEVKSIMLEFGALGVKIKAETGDNAFDAFEEKVDGTPGLPGGVTMEYPHLLVNGKFLDDALRVVETPNVRVCYGGASSPLRLESGAYVECIWPKVV